MNNERNEKLLYMVTVLAIAIAVIIFFAWHNIVSGTYPLGLCSECHT